MGLLSALKGGRGQRVLAAGRRFAAEVPKTVEPASEVAASYPQVYGRVEETAARHRSAVIKVIFLFFFHF